MNPLVTFQYPFYPTPHHPQYQQFATSPQIPINPYLYSPSSYELSLLRFKAFKLAQFKALSSQITPNDIKRDAAIKIEELTCKIESDIKTETSQEQATVSNIKEAVVPSSFASEKTLKTDIQSMVRFLLSNMGKDNEALLDKTRGHYSQNETLLQIYDKLRTKYYSAKRCKEDIIRCVLRKVFRYLRTSIMKEQQVCSKKATLILCKRHFYEHAQELGKLDSLENEDQILESLMPFNKNSKNKTMNLKFVLEVFTSKSFCEAYEAFLPQLNKIIAEEHNKKEEKLVSLLVECAKKKNFAKLKALSRLPWTDVWIEDAKNIAIGIMPGKRLVYAYKKTKI